jgi:hypothetical protein
MILPGDLPPSAPLEHTGEPSVLDGLKALLRGHPIPIPPLGSESIAPEPVVEPPPHRSKERKPVRPKYLRFPLALFLASIAQAGLSAHGSDVWLELAFYLIAAALAVWAWWAGDLDLIEPPSSETLPQEPGVRPKYLLAAGVLGLITFLASAQNQFTLINVTAWVGSTIAMVGAFWQGPFLPLRDWLGRLMRRLGKPELRIELSGWSLLVLAAFLLAAYFRLVNLAGVPREMWSDHAEKLLDVVDVLNGQYSIFFPRNTGREAIQFYMAAATASLLGTGISFMTLKIGTAVAGIIAVPFIYLFAKEMAGRWAALAAMALAGIAYWPNLISRDGLRFPLYPMLAAPALYFLVRGLRLRSRNDLLIAGFFTGLALHGYSPARILPLVVAAGVGIYLLHRTAGGIRWRMVTWLAAAGAVAWMVFMPLFRVALSMRQLFMYRMLTRMGPIEQPLPGPPLTIFLSNLAASLKMFAWDDGEIWVAAIPHRPALDWVTGALFHLGLAIVLVRYLKKRRWQDLFLLLSIPLLMLPSILSLAFPAENPALNRSSGAIIPVFTIAGIMLAAIPGWARKAWQSLTAYRLALGATLLIFVLSASINYHLVLVDFSTQMIRGIWNTSEIGSVIAGFARSVGSYNSAYVVPYPYWVDTRLVGINAGRVTKDYAVSRDALSTTLKEPGAKLFVIKPEDAETVAALRQLYPDGHLSRYVSDVEGHDFLLFNVPSQLDLQLEPTPTPP